MSTRVHKAAFAGRGPEITGLVLIVVGVLTGLAVFFDATGRLGSALVDATGWSVGLLRYVVPWLLVVLGAVVLRTRRDEDAAVRMAVGLGLLVVALAGLLHLTRGQPVLDDPSDAIARAGGALGILVGGGLASIAAPGGAGVLLAALAVFAVTIVTRSSLRVVADRTAAGIPAVGRVMREAFHGLLRGPSDEEVIDLTEEPPAKSSRRRAPAAAASEDAAAPPAPAAETDAGTAPAPAAPKAKPEPRAKVKVPSRDDADEAGEFAAGAVAHAPWRLPPLKLLERSGDRSIDHAKVEERGVRLERALAEHGVETRLVGMVVGPTVTRYELELGPGVKVARVTSLNKDIAYSMASPDVRILAPIPGRRAIGVEVPNEEREVVTVGDILASPEARKAVRPLEVAVGRDINGRSVLLDLAKTPHILIAGATGAGKSSCINSLITSILMRSTPDHVRMILIDPKMVEMGQYERVPHLLTQVVTDPKKAANALAWACREMDRRYELLSEVGYRDIDGYNAAHDAGKLASKHSAFDEHGQPRQFPRLPYILVVVDELADLMMVAARDVEESICRIAQKARAVGIHLVIATQRPSVNVITGLIKANIPARLAFAVSSLADSRVILDQPGAERLVGKGDMLLLPPSSNTTQRIQGSWVSEEEVRRVVEVWRSQAQQVEPEPLVVSDTDEMGTPALPFEPGHAPAFPQPFPGSPGAASPTAVAPMAFDEITGGSGPSGWLAELAEEDDLLPQAAELVVNSQLGSTSMLQRKLRVGFARAGRIMDLLEQHGVVGPSEGSKAREVLMSPEEYQARTQA
ncbi:MAG: DNA translocase FtsK [Acidimicrobiales bacterium]|nr:DNA translocase FtsK [Acidimicrobiales bacterium]